MNAKKSGSSAPRGDVANSTIKPLWGVATSDGQVNLLLKSLAVLATGATMTVVDHRIAPLVFSGIVFAFGIFADFARMYSRAG